MALLARVRVERLEDAAVALLRVGKGSGRKGGKCGIDAERN